MQFTYDNDVPTVEAAMYQAVEAAGKARSRGHATDIAEEGLAEIRRILSRELSTLRDDRDVAQEANEVVMQAMALVEGRLG